MYHTLTQQVNGNPVGFEVISKVIEGIKTKGFPLESYSAVAERVNMCPKSFIK